MKLRTAASPSRLAAALVLAAAACKTPPPAPVVYAEWSAFETLNPTDIAVAPVESNALPRELRAEVLRDAMKEQLLAHRYSPLSYDYLDGRAPADASSGGAASTTMPADAARVDLVVKKFDASRYSISHSVHVAGDFYFRNAASGETLATLSVDRVIDLSAEARRGAPLEEALRTAARRFVETGLAGMPTRKIETARATS